MKYVITGGAGFIGSNIAEALVNKGEDVVVIDDLSTGKLDNIKSFLDKITFIKGSILDLNLLKKYFNDADFILHQAAISSIVQSISNPYLTNEVNIGGTLNVLTAARKCNIKRVVYAASSSTYRNSSELPKVEEMPQYPLSPYALTKLTGEYYCKIFSRIYGLETVILRYFNVFGPRQDPKSPYSAVIPKFIIAMLNDKQPVIFGDGLTSRDFVYIKNVINANILACNVKGIPGEVFNIACGKKTNLLELIEKINKILGKSIKPIHKNERRGDIKHSLADISKAKKRLGYEVEVPFDEGLKKTIEWYKQSSGNKKLN